MSYTCEDFPCCGHYDEGGNERGIPYCPRPYVQVDMHHAIQNSLCLECGDELHTETTYQFCYACRHADEREDYPEDEDYEPEYEFVR